MTDYLEVARRALAAVNLSPTTASAADSTGVPRDASAASPVAQPLPAGDQLEAAEDQVEAVGVAGPGRIGMGVERPLGHRVPGHGDRNSEPVLAQRPLAEPPLVLLGARSGSPRGSAACPGRDGAPARPRSGSRGPGPRDHGQGRARGARWRGAARGLRRPPSRRSRRGVPP